MYQFIVSKRGIKDGDYFDFGVVRQIDGADFSALVKELGGEEEEYHYSPITNKILRQIPEDKHGRVIFYEIETREIPEIKTNVFKLKTKKS